MSFVAFISYTALVQAQTCGSLDIAEDKKYLTTKRSLCCEKSLLKLLEDYRDQWQAGTDYPDPSGLFGSCNSTPTPTPTPNPNPNPTSVRVYHKECVCKYPNNTNVAFIPEYGTTGGTVLRCPEFDKIGEQNASSYSIETGSGYTQNEGPHTLECCKWHVWKYLVNSNPPQYSPEEMKERAIQAMWMEGQNSAKTEKFCCLPGRRGDKYGDSEWIPQGVDGQGNDEIGCCDKRYIFASKQCCESAFSDVQDENNNPKTKFVDGKNKNDLSLNKCCSLTSYAFVESISQFNEYEKQTPPPAVEQVCCEADEGIFFAKDTSAGISKALCCDENGPYDKTNKAFPPPISGECCKAYGGELASDSTDNPMPTEKEHCCDPNSPQQWISWDSTTGKAVGAITETCCESMNGVYHSVTESNGDIKGICCLGMKQWDNTTGAWSKEDSLECCRGAEEQDPLSIGLAPVFKFSDRCCVNDAKTNKNSPYAAAIGPKWDDENKTLDMFADICCIKGTTREAEDGPTGGTPSETCCTQAGNDLNLLVKWIANKQICCLEDHWVWKYADEVKGSGGMCKISASDSSDTSDSSD